MAPEIDMQEPLPVGRAPVQYYGGKGRMVSKLMRLVPLGGRPYCEAFCGAASLLFSRPIAPVEVINDLDEDLINLFRCLQEKETFDELKHRLSWTLYSRAEFAKALEIRSAPNADAVSRAWAFFVTQNQSISGCGKSVGNWSRTFSTVGAVAKCTNTWMMRLSLVDAFRLRLMPVQVDCRPALDILAYWDTPEAVFYLDPPYPEGTRQKANRREYAHEMSDSDHIKLIDLVLVLGGAVVISSYHNPIYERLGAAGWVSTDFQTSADSAGRTRKSALQGAGAATKKVPRTEVVWQNPRALEMLALQESKS